MGREGEAPWIQGAMNGRGWVDRTYTRPSGSENLWWFVG